MFGMSELRKTRVYQEAIEEGQELERRRSLEAGAKLLVRLLQCKFGTLNPAIVNNIVSLSLEQLEQLSEAILDFDSIQGIEEWLENIVDILTVLKNSDS